MGYHQENQEKLIDFLYKDQESIDSLYAQLFQGKIESIVKQESSLDKETSFIGSDVKFVAANTGSESSTNESMSFNISPHDHRIIQLLENLDLDLFKSSLNGVNDNKLICVKGDILIRNTALMHEILGLSDLFSGIPGFERFNQPFTSTKKGKPVTFIDAIKRMTSLIPKGIEMDIYLSQECIIYASLIESYISPSFKVLLDSYANTLPKDCYIIGVINKRRTSSITSKSQLKAPLDEVSKALLKLINSDDSYHYTLKPLIIYRYLDI